MPRTEILAAGNTAALSDDVGVATGEAVEIGVENNPGPAELLIMLKGEDDDYQPIGKVWDNLPVTLREPGVYRLRRAAGVTCGGYRD